MQNPAVLYRRVFEKLVYIYTFPTSSKRVKAGKNMNNLSL